METQPVVIQEKTRYPFATALNSAPSLIARCSTAQYSPTIHRTAHAQAHCNVLTHGPDNIISSIFNYTKDVSISTKEEYLLLTLRSPTSSLCLMLAVSGWATSRMGWVSAFQPSLLFLKDVDCIVLVMTIPDTYMNKLLKSTRQVSFVTIYSVIIPDKQVWYAKNWRMHYINGVVEVLVGHHFQLCQKMLLSYVHQKNAEISLIDPNVRSLRAALIQPKNLEATHYSKSFRKNMNWNLSLWELDLGK